MVVYSHAHYLGGFGTEPLARITGHAALGPLAVHGFFVISGLLVSESFRRSPSLFSYVAKRALRLVPGLWVCLAVTAFILTPLAWWLNPSPDAPLPSYFSDQIRYVVSNLIQPRSLVNVGGLPNGPMPMPGDWNGSLWTLFYEGACYLMVGGLGVLTLLNRRRAAGLAILLGFLALHAIWCVAPQFFPTVIGRLFDTSGKREVLHFLAGVAWGLAPATITERLRSWPFALPCAVALVASWFTSAEAWVSPLLIPPVVFALAAMLPFKAWEKKMRGDYSYGLYLYHYPICQLLALLGAHHLGFTWYALLALLATAPVALLSWRFVEGPALKFKPGQRAKPAAA